MKKLALVLVLIVLTLSFTLTGCNKASTQGQLVNILANHNHEVFTYDVSDSSGVIGSYVVTLDKKASQDSFTFGDENTTIKVNEGILAQAVLTVGTTTYNTGCYYDLISGSSFMTPAYTYRVKNVDGQETFKLFGKYDGTSLNYDKWINGGEKQSGTVTAESSPYYDNNEFHQLLRGVTTFSTSFSFSYAVPLVSETESTSVSLTAACSTTETLQFNGADVNCYKVVVSRSTKVAGTTQTLYYSVDDIKPSLSGTGWPITHALLKIVEGNITYTLKSASLS